MGTRYHIDGTQEFGYNPINSRRYLGMTAAMTQVPVPTAI